MKSDLNSLSNSSLMTRYNAKNTKLATLHLTTEIKKQFHIFLKNLSKQTKLLKVKLKLNDKSEVKRRTHVSTLFIVDKT